MEDTAISGSKGRLERVRSNGFFVAMSAALVFCVYFAPARPARQIMLEYRINPNEASSAGLMLLPGVGLARANAIIEYRNRLQQQNQGPAFRDCNDIRKIKGIGPITAKGMCEFLKFE